MRRLTQIFASSVALLAPHVLCGADAEVPRRAEGAETQPAEKEVAPTKGLTLDFGKFTSYARGIVVQIGKDADGRSSVNVNVDKPGVKVDVRRDAAGKPHVDVDLNLDRLGRGQSTDEPDRVVDKDTNVDLGAPAGADDDPVVAPKPAALPARETYIGLFTRNVPDELAAQLGSVLGEHEGLLVLEVVPDSPAAKAGLKKHDILVRYDDHKIAKVQELKEFIAVDKPGRTVKLSIIRAAAPQTVEVVLGEREATRSRDQKNVQIDKAVRVYEQLADEKDQPRIISKKLIRVPGVTIQLGGSEAPEAIRPKVVTGKKVLITTENGTQFKVAVKYVAADGTAVERSYEGTAAELDDKLKDLPDEIQSGIHRTLEGLDSDKGQSRAFRFNVEPRVEGDRRVLRISMQRPGAAGETRILEIEQRFDGHESIQVADLMKIDVVASELKNLGPAVREKVEATLNRMQIPEVRVGVEKSQ